MSVKNQKQALESMKQAEQMHHAMHTKAQEMIELMTIVKRDARKRAYQSNRMVKLMEAGKINEAKQLFAEMKTWKRYKINL